MTEPTLAPLPRMVWGVSGLLQAVSDALALRFGSCAVRGEVSGFSRASSGHCYFNLKDAERGEGTLRCALFKRAAGLLDFAPADGQLVDVRGRIGIYGPRGELQFIVESMQRTGAGALYEQFLRLRARLESEGLFDAARKQPLPAFPQRLGVVTSLGAAALHDVLTALERRAPHVSVIIYPSLVQGPEAPAALCAALARANDRAEVDALILCRGGGSLEDIWAFNDERVARAVRASVIPLVCGVGHETDVTLADLAADLRAPTPTAAAELASTSRGSLLEALAVRANALRNRVADRLDGQAQRLDHAALRLARPSVGAQRHAERLSLLGQRLSSAARNAPLALAHDMASRLERLRRAVAVGLARHGAHLRASQERLEALDPSRVLARGYALLTDAAGRAVVSVSQVEAGTRLRAHLGDGALSVAVTGVDPVA